MHAFVLFLCVCLVASVSNASSLFLDGNGSASLGLGDVLDQVVLTDTSHVDIDLGAIIGEVTLLDESTASIFDGTLSGALEVYDDAVATVHGTGFTVDGAPAPEPVVAIDCPTCTFAGTLAGGANLNVLTKVAYNGQINVVAVPEAHTVVLLGLGFAGLAVVGRRWRLD